MGTEKSPCETCVKRDVCFRIHAGNFVCKLKGVECSNYKVDLESTTGSDKLLITKASGC